MSFLYFRVPVAGYSLPNTCSDSERCVMSNPTETVTTSSRPDSETDCLTTRRSTTTLEHSTGDAGVDAWILSLLDSRVRPSRVPVPAWGKMIRAISGLTPFASLTKCGRSGSFWKTHPTYDAIDGKKVTPRRKKARTSGKYLATWPAAGLMLDGKCYRLKTAVHVTAAGGSGLLPTPVASDATRGGNTRFSRGNPCLTLALRRLPTVTVKGNHNRVSYSDKSGDGLITALKKLPTVIASDYRSGKRKTCRRRRGYNSLPEALTAVVGGDDGLLAPRFAEWMMGFPDGWTGFEPVEKDKFQSWLQQHSGCLAGEAGESA